MKNNNLLREIKELCKYMNGDGGLKVEPFPKLRLSKDKSYVNDIFGRTAWYSPEEKCITLITEGRHPKDILRSFSHEMIHHAQNLRGDMDESSMEDLSDPNYTQNNKHLRKMEAEAYLRGNMIFRDFEDKRKKKK